MRLILPLLLVALPAQAQQGSCDGTCLSHDDSRKVAEALRELKQIKESEARIEFRDPVVIVRDWDDRVYVNGGEARPLRLTLRVGTVERDMEAVVPVQVGYRERPPDPPFRLRLRAQAGILMPALLRRPKDGFDAGFGFDFFHLGELNLAVHAGFRSAGCGVGLDVTKNFGPYVGYSVVYDGWSSGILSGVYMSFN